MILTSNKVPFVEYKFAFTLNDTSFPEIVILVLSTGELPKSSTISYGVVPWSTNNSL